MRTVYARLRARQYARRDMRRAQRRPRALWRRGLGHGPRLRNPRATRRGRFPTAACVGGLVAARDPRSGVPVGGAAGCG
eukprot:8074902-Pyramimonas_sp.AAC.1